MDAGAFFTVTVHFAVTPLLLFAVIVAVPLEIPFTLPALTVATPVLELVQVMVLFAAFEGVTVAVSEIV